MERAVTYEEHAYSLYTGRRQADRLLCQQVLQLCSLPSYAIRHFSTSTVDGKIADSNTLALTVLSRSLRELYHSQNSVYFVGAAGKSG
jgi:hypothetical protein